MFRVEGIYREKFAPDGSFLRFQNAFNIHLNTVDGVIRFLDEQKPFRDVRVYDAVSGEDVTEEFLK